MLTIFQYPKCSTCRKAVKWLEEKGHGYRAHDLVGDPIALDALTDLHRRSGLPIARFFNTSGESYRNGNFKEKLKALTQAEALRALSKDGKLVKRPILDAGKVVLVGFDPDAWQKSLG